jgi:hypothetical protein
MAGFEPAIVLLVPHETKPSAQNAKSAVSIAPPQGHRGPANFQSTP